MDTKEYIIDVAFKLFLNHSYEAVSISTISNAVGMTKGALYHHFLNKEELFKAVIDKHFNITGVDVDVVNISLEKYTEACIAHARKILNTMCKDKDEFIPPINYISIVADGFRHYENFSTKRLTFVDAQINHAKIVLDNAIKSGEIRKDIDTKVVAMQYFSLSIGMAGSIIRNNSINSAIKSMKEQLNQLYHLLKK